MVLGPEYSLKVSSLEAASPDPSRLFLSSGVSYHFRDCGAPAVSCTQSRCPCECGGALCWASTHLRPQSCHPVKASVWWCVCVDECVCVCVCVCVNVNAL